MMFAITGITGQVGGATARGLLAAGHNVRAVLRDPKKGSEWVKQGCEVAVAEMTDSAALSGAFSNAEGVFVLYPASVRPGARLCGGAVRDRSLGRGIGPGQA